MHFKRFLSCLVCFAGLLTFTSCSKEEATILSGNLGELTSEPGDVFAVFDFLDYGEVTFKLFPQIAPVAVEKFIKLAERGYYDNRNIHRVLNDYFFQGGSVNFDGTDGEVQEGEYFDIETSDYAKNFYGALCFAANSNGKNYRQIYFVCNRSTVDIDKDISKLEEQINDSTKTLTDVAKEKYTELLKNLKAIPDDIKEQYATRSGVYNQDGKNTVFGQVSEGLSVINAIAETIVVAGNSIDDAKNVHSKPLNEIIIKSVKIVRIPLPEPTTIETEESTKKTRKTAAVTTIDTNSPDALTDKVAFGDTTTTPNDDDAFTDSDVETISETSDIEETTVSES